MNFSYEELYFMYGQYDRFVSLSFHKDSEADKTLNSDYFMGSFKFSHEEVKHLEKLRGTKDIPRTEKKVRFVPSKLYELDDKTTTYLDRDGILCSDICLVSARNFPKENRFTVKGEKEIPNTITVNVDMSDVNVDLLKLGLMKSRIKNGYIIRDFEWEEYYGLMCFYHNDVVKNEKKIFSNFEKQELIPPIRYHFLMTKYLNDSTTEGEFKELIELGKKRNDEKIELLVAELKRSNEKLNEVAKIHGDKMGLIYGLTIKFETEILLPYKFSIWWDFERFIHIYIRHVKETQVGERFTGKSVFKYKFKEIKRLIEIVLEIVHDEIEKHFEVTPDKPFIRMGDRAVPYDGHFYRVEVEPTGRLREFHPFNVEETIVAEVVAK